LRKAEEKLKLPEQPPANKLDEASRMRSTIPLRLTFSIVRVKRDDPAEAVLLALLEKCDALHDAPPPDAVSRAEPAAYAVLGRGRALPSLSGEDFTPEAIRGVAKFVSAACSCMVKELNPGMDLLMSEPWEESIFANATKSAASPEPDRRDFPKPQPLPIVVSVPQPASVEATPPAVSDGETSISSVALLIAACIVTLVAAAMWYRAR